MYNYNICFSVPEMLGVYMSTYVSIKEAAELAGVSTKTIRRYLNKGVIVSKTVKGKRGMEYRLLKSSLLQHFRRIGYGSVPSDDIGEDEGQTIVRLRNLVPKYMFDELKQQRDQYLAENNRLEGVRDWVDQKYIEMKNKLMELTSKLAEFEKYKYIASQHEELKARIEELNQRNSILLQELAEKDTLIKILEQQQSGKKSSTKRKSPSQLSINTETKSNT